MHHESKTKRFTHQATLQEAALMGASHHHWAMDGAEAVPDEAEADDGDTEAKPAEAPSEVSFFHSFVPWESIKTRCEFEHRSPQSY